MKKKYLCLLLENASSKYGVLCFILTLVFFPFANAIKYISYISFFGAIILFFCASYDVWKQSNKSNDNNVLSYCLYMALSGMKKTNNTYKIKVLYNKRLLKKVEDDELTIPSLIDIDTLYAVLSKDKYTINDDLTTAVMAVKTLADEINKKQDKCKEYLLADTDEAITNFWSLFVLYCKFYYVLNKIILEGGRFSYKKENDQEIAEQVAHAFELPFHIDDVVSSEINKVVNK